MTKQELQQVVGQVKADTLMSRAGISFYLKGNGIVDVDACLAYCQQQGWLHCREQFGVEEWYRDGKPEWQATKFSTPRTPACQVLPPKNLAPIPPVVTAPVRRKAAPAPVAGGLF